MQTIFWCEFPEKVDWDEARKTIKFDTEIYVAAKTRKEYEDWKKRVKTKNIGVGAWPRLDEEEGYWFSGHLEKEQIDKLKEFRGLKIKVDIEPPFPGKGFSMIKAALYLLRYTLRKGKNNQYLEETIKKLGDKVIISGFPLPGWITKRYGDITRLDRGMEKNFISYTTLFIRPISRWYAKRFARSMIKRYGNKAMFALGCTGPGVFGNERTYKNLEQFREDLKMIRETGAEKIVVFNIEGIMEREDREEWIRACQPS